MGETEIILQGFDWNSAINYRGSYYQHLLEQLPQIKKAGFTAIWLPPPWKDSSDNQVGYFWQDFQKNSAYGTDEALKILARVLTAQGIKIIYDLVLNHRDLHAKCGEPWASIPLPQQRANLEYKQYHHFALFDQGQNDLNLQHPAVQTAFVDELCNLIMHYHAQGFRFDFAKGFDPHIPQQLIASVRAKLATFNYPMPELFMVGEYWDLDQDHLKKIWADSSHCKVFDFPLQHQFKEKAFSNSGMKKGLHANPDPEWRRIAVTFVDNHDTGYSETHDHKKFFYRHYAPDEKGLSVPNQLRAQAYAYLLLAPGTPCVYWPHWAVWGPYDGLHALIDDLILLRKAAQITEVSSIEFDKEQTEGAILATIVGARGDQLKLGIYSTGNAIIPSSTPELMTFSSKLGWGFIQCARTSPLCLVLAGLSTFTADYTNDNAMQQILQHRFFSPNERAEELPPNTQACRMRLD